MLAQMFRETERYLKCRWNKGDILDGLYRYGRMLPRKNILYVQVEIIKGRSVKGVDGMDIGKSNRVLFLYSRLAQGQKLKKNELAEEFGISDKSIQRDFEAIRVFLDRKDVEDGVRMQLVYDHQEKAYHLEQDNRMNLSNTEILAVSKILLESRAFTRQEMMDILDKLVANCVPKKNLKLVEEMLSNERHHYVELQHHRPFMDKLMPLATAIKENRVIRIKYEKMKGKETVERRLEPLAILFSEYYFYLVGFIEGIDKEKAFENANDPFPTIYRIDRVKELELLDEWFRIPRINRFEEGEFRKRIQFMFGGKLRKVRFKYLGESVEAVLDRLPTAKVIGEEDGAYVVVAEVFGKGIDMWVRSQGELISDYQTL